MPAYFVTWDKDDWPYEKLLPIVEKFKKYGHVENRWSCGTTKKIQLNDRVFLIKRGKGRRGIFGSGNVTKVPFLDRHYNSEEAEKGKECLFINIDFDYISDPEKKIVIDREELNAPDFAGSFWNSQGSGKTIPYKISQALERLWASRTGASEIQYPEQILTDSLLIEGATKQVQVNVFERDSKARQQCIDYYGLNCVACNFHFELAYGQLAKGYIHVHHLTPLSEINEEYVVNPIEDLRPVCPNCHAMLHQKGVPSGIDGINEIQKLFKIYNK